MNCLTDATIIAQCTPSGSGAIALLRLSGPDAISITDKFSRLPQNIALGHQASHTVHYGQIIDQGQVVDQVMLIVMQAPKTFTGENVVEITCHNNPFIIEKIISLALSYGARLAHKGEFAQRAFLNNKIDLTQAEAINSLIHAHTEQAMQKSLAQLKGSLTNWSKQIEQSLYKCLALSEASFEFIDEEMDFSPQIKAELQLILSQIGQAQASFELQQQIKDGVRIAIIGSVNAGKSALFNALLKRDRAIVTPIAGTTRDSIEAGIYTNQHYLTLVDTAGLRQTEDYVEQIGIERSMAEAQGADLILLVFDTSRLITPAELSVYEQIFQQYHDKIILVGNKADQAHKLELPPTMAELNLVSSQTKLGLEKLEELILARIKALLETDSSPFLLNQRQFQILSSISTNCQQILKMLEQPEYELISLHLNETLQSLSALTGQSITEQGLETIFREFCVGK